MAQSEIGHLFVPLALFFTLFLSLIYLFCFLYFRYAWLQLKEVKKEEFNPNYQATASVIIAARNEAENLPALLQSLSNQSYPKPLFDVILIDDHSSIPICSLLNQEGEVDLKILSLNESESGKKDALLKGVMESKNEYLIFTDADCTFGPDWIATHIDQLENSDSQLNIGLVDYRYKPEILNSFYTLDLLSMVSLGAAMARIGRPTMCNGANLAIRRDTYLELSSELRTHFISGDDMFLLHTLKKRKDATVIPLKSKENIVYSSPPTRILEFINQRARWASKAKGYTDRDTILLSMLVFLLNFGIAICLISLIYHPNNWVFLMIPIILKTIADVFFLSASLTFFQKKKSLMLVPIFQLIYPFYISLTAILGLFGLFKWKDRFGLTTQKQ